MSIHQHILKGCAPAPLANYLKALGVLRLVGEQADKQARGWWNGETFHLLTKLSKEELEEFFLERYEPTPIFNPWGGRSGYYAESSEKTARAALTAIEESTLDRLENFRGAVSLIRSVIVECGGKKPDSEETKTALLSRIRLRLRGSGSDWLETVMADLGDSYRGPAILGTGGNEGSGSYTAAFLAAVVECVIRRTWDQAIPSSLWTTSANLDAWNGDFTPPASATIKKLKKQTIAGPFRQFLPSGKRSPWELLLCFEGSIVIQSGVSRRSNADQHRFLSSPFYFAPLGVGAGSSSEIDEYTLVNGKKTPGRGEQWFPLWGTPSTFTEIQLLFREGRCSIGRRSVRTPLDAVRSICGLGTTRGITAFLRYGYFQRDGQSHIAIPLGRIIAPTANGSEQTRTKLIDDISTWMDRLHKTARAKNAPDRLKHAFRRLADVVFAALTHDHTPERWQAILLAAADIESLQATGTAIDEGRMTPIPLLRPEWVDAVNDNTPELRLALALGSAAAPSVKGEPRDPIRHHWLPLDEKNSRQFRIADKKLFNDPRVVASGRDAVRDLTAVVERRLIEAAQKSERRSRLVAKKGCEAHLVDLAEFLTGQLDLNKLLGLARAFMAIRWNQWDAEKHCPQKPEPSEMPEKVWLAVRLANLPGPMLGDDRDIPADARIVRLLAVGNASRAIEIACTRLRSGGIRPPMQAGMIDAPSARLWAVALAFPIDWKTANDIAERLDPQPKL